MHQFVQAKKIGGMIQLIEILKNTCVGVFWDF